MSRAGRSARRRSPSAARPGSALPSATAPISKRPAPAIRGQDGCRRPRSPDWRRPASLQLRKVGPRSYLLSPRPERRAAAPPARLGASCSAPAAAPSRRERQDIVVTASKRDIAVAALRRPVDAHRRRRIRAARALPEPKRSRRGRSASPRPILAPAETSCSSAGSPIPASAARPSRPVGQYFGDMRTGYSGPDPDLKLVDMQSVEMLEGPQGTLYGSGALGGIILLKPNMPRFRRARRSIASAACPRPGMAIPATMCPATINAPLADTVAAAGGRLSCARGRLYRQSRDRRAGHQRCPGRRRPRHSVGRARRPAGSSTLPASPSGSAATTANMPTSDGSGLTRDSLVDQPFSSDFALASFVVRKDSGTIRFRSTTGASWQDVDENFDASIGGDVRQLAPAQPGAGRSATKPGCGARWPTATAGWPGFSSIIHRYEVAREVAEEGVNRRPFRGREPGARDDRCSARSGSS